MMSEAKRRHRIFAIELCGEDCRILSDFVIGISLGGICIRSGSSRHILVRNSQTKIQTPSTALLEGLMESDWQSALFLFLHPMDGSSRCFLTHALSSSSEMRDWDRGWMSDRDDEIVIVSSIQCALRFEYASLCAVHPICHCMEHQHIGHHHQEKTKKLSN